MTICSPRTDSDSVETISGTTLGSGVIDMFIQSATLVIDSIATCASNYGVTDEQLSLAECWLTAHMISISDVGQANGTGVKKSETFENYKVEYAVSASTGQGVLSTGYGRTANSLTKGCLAEVDKRQAKVGFCGGAG